MIVYGIPFSLFPSSWVGCDPKTSIAPRDLKGLQPLPLVACKAA
jgi:hypothetical protein